MLPIIKSRPPQVIVVEMETEWSDKPELCAYGDTGAADATGVVGDFRFIEYDV
jgi:hypothetical protein